MFWRFGGYASVSAIDTLLEKPDVTLEELLDESDLIQELKSQTPKLIEFLRDETILESLLDLVIAPKSEEAPESDVVKDKEDKRDSTGSGGFFGKSRSKGRSKSVDNGETEAEKRERQRLKYSYVACEILSCDVWSITEAILANPTAIRRFWGYLHSEAPLDPLQAGYFTKVNEALLEKKTEEMVAIVKTLDNLVDNIIKHVDCPLIMDLLLKLITLEKEKGGQGICDWIQAQNLIPLLLSLIGPDHSYATQTSAGDFIKAVITISANATGQDASVIGPNELTRQLVSESCVQTLVTEMLRGGNPLTVGVGIVIEVIRKNNSDYDVESGVGPVPKSSDPIYLGNLLRLFALHIPQFVELILSDSHTITTDKGPDTRKRQDLKVAWGRTIEPLGFDRFKTCELMAELLHCSNMGLLNEKGSAANVRARDAERERLKAEGKLSASEQPSSAEFGTSIDSAGFHHADADSAEDGDRLEVQNNVDEDGFEKVARSEATEPGLEDLLEQPELERPTRLDSDSDDAEFVDEPISPPKLGASHSRNASTGDVLSTTPPDLTDQVEELDLDKDVVMAESDEEDDQTVTAGTPTSSKPRISLLTEQFQTGKPVKNDLEEAFVGDQPAPLFANRSNDSKTSNNPGGNLQPTSVQSQSESGTVSDAEEGSQNAMLTEESQQDLPIIEKEDDGSPLVGDYLKIMFVENLVVPTILDFFFRFPWNNFLHNVVYDVVQQVFNGQMDRGYNRYLATDLFETGRITERIVEGQQTSDKAQEEHNMRLGYMGHLTLIAEEVVKFNERQPPELLSELVATKVNDEKWVNYVEQVLAETRERDNAILGGVRPDLAGGPRQAVLNAVNAASGGFGGSSNALANAGLGGGGLDSLDLANAGYGNSLLSGFGSSSDEDDEDMEESELAENEMQSSSRGIEDEDQDLDAFAAPPPIIPAPLSIPPSRARRELARRLAQKQRAAAAAASLDENDDNAIASSSAATGTSRDGNTSTVSDFGGLYHDEDNRIGSNDGFTAFGRDSDSDDNTDEDEMGDEDDDVEEADLNDIGQGETTTSSRRTVDANIRPLRRQLTRESVERIPLDDGEEDGDENETDDTAEERATDESTGDESEDSDGTIERMSKEAKLREQEKLLRQWGLSDKPSSSRTKSPEPYEDDDDDEAVEIGSKFMRKRGSST